MKRRLPTDREILRAIYDTYLPLYPGPPTTDGKHENDPFLPIDIEVIAERLGCSHHLLFGRLYYYMTPRHRHGTDENNQMPLFTPRAGAHRHAVNFPYLTSVLATYDDEYQKHVWAIAISALSLVVSVAAFVVSVLNT